MSCTTDDVLKAYSHPLRRFLVYQLKEGDTPSSISEIAAAAAESLPTVSNDQSDLEAALRHRHIPHLEKSNLITWDASAESIEFSAFDDTASHLIDSVVQIEDWD